MINITTHGAPFILQLGKNLVSGSNGASNLAKSISKVENSPQKINFISCYSANGGIFSNAQMLANRTGLPVVGYQGKVSLLAANNIINYGTTFYPQDGLTAQVCSSMNSLLGVSTRIRIAARELLN